MDSMKTKTIILVLVAVGLIMLGVILFRRSTSKGEGANGCVRGGCSSQLCLEANSPELMSTCEYKSEYGCYQKAECKRQKNGKCEFTRTTGLANCLKGINPH